MEFLSFVVIEIFVFWRKNSNGQLILYSLCEDIFVQIALFLVADFLAYCAKLRCILHFFFILAGRKPLFMNYLSCSLSLYPQTQHQFHINLDKSLHTIFGNFSNFHCALKNLSRMYLCTLMHCYKQLKKA